MNFMQNGVSAFKGGEGMESRWLELMLKEWCPFIFYNVKDEDVNENILWIWIRTEWDT